MLTQLLLSTILHKYENSWNWSLSCRFPSYSSI